MWLLAVGLRKGYDQAVRKDLKRRILYRRDFPWWSKG
jgi:hypothetical protein